MTQIEYYGENKYSNQINSGSLQESYVSYRKKKNIERRRKLKGKKYDGFDSFIIDVLQESIKKTIQQMIKENITKTLNFKL